ncbi:uncharacterized protein BJ171DRAFT_492135 [Polychytrium aggregatum]|uniref:uncharacterized protein n=1 Tax=Polychytrium aggregatum TaxID=110093 RepID=UPI0022FEC1B7|nr:uncharacterized protein BJ171DRAFT_492135 [Polychytrium aggregatum]KAI9207945.1 hypothetical protein BJ171DRAFT_492135 [Polychytrium aggregatum]
MVSNDEQHQQQPFELRSVSVMLDGRVSIEHQLGIYISDLIDYANDPDIELDTALESLKYVMEYRIKGKKMPHLDAELMRRLVEALLQHCKHKTGSLIKQIPTKEADMAFTLFGEFLDEVEEFRDVVSKKNSVDLKETLMIHRRCQPWCTFEQREDSAAILGLLMQFPHFDWKDLVKADEHDDVQKLMDEFPQKFASPAMPLAPQQLYPPSALYFDKNSEALAKMYHSDVQVGLSQDKVEVYREHYGVNKLPDPPRPSVWKLLFTQITDFMVIILIIAAIVEGVTDSGDLKSSAVLLIVVVINVIIGFSQEYKANKAMEALMSLSVPKATVIRAGKQESLDAAELVPGDLVVLEEGDAVPADLRLCEVAQLEIVESVLTGESVAAPKSIRTIRRRTRKLPLAECKGNAFMCTVVARGRGKGIVVRTGLESEIGRISQAITSTPHQMTHIQKKLQSLGTWLVIIAFLLCAIVIGIGLLHKNPVAEMIRVGVSLAVSVIPEGLVAVVTVTMALGVRRMAQENAIVRKLVSVESLGSVTVICSDKTGTLTEGKMGTAEIWASDNNLYLYTHSTSMDPEKGCAQLCAPAILEDAMADTAEQIGKKDEQRKQGASNISKSLESCPPSLLLSTMVSCLCNNGTINKDPETNKWKPIGDPTEIAMVIAAQKVGFTREWFQNNLGLQKLGEYAFDSDRKLMSAVFALGSPKSGIYELPASDLSFVLVKGAPEGVLSKCTHYFPPITTGQSALDYIANAAPVPLDDRYVAYVSERATSMASKGLRVLALAMKRQSVAEGSNIIAGKKESLAESNLGFVGLIGLIDPPKEGVKESIASCHRAGITVIMITGDHVNTAVAIAKQLGIINPENPSESRAMKGYEIDVLSEEALAQQRPFPRVFARVSPDNKLKIVKALQKARESVAMTGDGVNDAPAIKKADVGIAMGIGGTEITKQAADIVLADDNFSTIVEAIREGRRVFDNIQKFVVYLLSCNSAEIILFLLAAIINVPTPFSTIQILWANVIADIPPAMALGGEPHERSIMNRKPKDPTKGVLDFVTCSIIIAQGLTQSLLTLAVFLMAENNQLHIKNDLSFNRSMAFTVLTMMQLIQGFYARSIDSSVFRVDFFSNKFMIGAVALSTVFLVMGLYVPGLNTVLELEDIGAIGWGIVFICLVIQLVIVELLKVFARRFKDVDVMGKLPFRRKKKSQYASFRSDHI